MKILKKTSLILFTLFIAINIPAQIPTHIDPGQNENPVSLYEQPEFIIPILGLFVLLVGYYVYRKRRKK